MLFGIVTYAAQRGKRDFTSTSQVVATNYDVVVAFEAAHEARRLLQQLPMSPSDASGARPATSPQRDYQGQPYQHPGQQGPAPQGPAPQRPAGWNDPYGQRQDSQPQGAPAEGTPAQGGAPVQGEPVQGAQAAEPEVQPPSPAVRYPDLPDGRPQYGVRVSDSGQAPQHKDEEHR
jgi:hypothetical protein